MEVTVEEFMAMVKRRHKYNAKATTVGGVKFQSKREAERWMILLYLSERAKIHSLMRQVRYDIIINGVLVCRYVADFVYVRDGVKVVEDVKGYRTPIYRLKKKLMLAVNAIEIQEV